jgi:hypothetical protein
MAAIPEQPKRRLLGEIYFPGGLADALGLLAGKAISENWGENNWILKNYVEQLYLFSLDQKILEINRPWACFNTGLFTPEWEPIFGLLEQNKNKDKQPWCFYKKNGRLTSKSRVTTISLNFLLALRSIHTTTSSFFDPHV